MKRNRMRVALAVAVPTLGLAGCYVVPVAPDGTPIYPYGPNTPVAIVPAPAVVAAPVAMPPPPVVASSKIPAVLTARLYPANEMAAQTGMLSGTVTNMMTGKGRFQLELRGEVLSGEATRVQGDEKRGVASAFGNRGTWMNCDYQMTSPYQGAGTCTISTGEKYSVHLGG